MHQRRHATAEYKYQRHKTNTKHPFSDSSQQQQQQKYVKNKIIHKNILQWASERKARDEREKRKKIAVIILLFSQRMAHIEFHVAHMHTEQIFVVQSPLHSGLRTFILILVVSQLINFLSFLVCVFFSLLASSTFGLFVCASAILMRPANVFGFWLSFDVRAVSAHYAIAESTKHCEGEGTKTELSFDDRIRCSCDEFCIVWRVCHITMCCKENEKPQ